MGDIIFLDLSEVVLFGVEDGKSELVVQAYMDHIRRGAVFPPVQVCEIGEGVYEMTWDGHHRAIAHYRTGTPLRCELSLRWEAPETRIRIQDIQVVPDNGEYARKREYYPEYL